MDEKGGIYFFINADIKILINVDEFYIAYFP